MNPLCTHIQDRLIEQHLSGQAGPDDAAIQAHLQTCAACRQFQDQLHRDHERLAQYARSVEPLVTSLQDRVARRLASVRQQGRFLQRLTHPVTLSAAAGVLIVVGLWVAVHGPQTRSASMQGQRRLAPERPQGPIGNTIPARPEWELAQAKALFAARDVDGLMNLLLYTGLAPTQSLAAGYLAELNASAALPALQRLASAWTGDPNANPFAQAMAHIMASSREPNNPPGAGATAKAPAATVDRILRFRVVDRATGQPLPGALISDEHAKAEYVCDANGCCQTGSVGAGREWLHFKASRPGYAGLCMMFLDPNAQILARTHVFDLEPGTVIGGIVQDANGLPIEDATVSFSIHSDHVNGDVNTTRPSLCVEFRQQTDAAGRWTCDTVPADLIGLARDDRFSFGVDNNDYASEWCSVRDVSTVGQLRDQTHRITLYEGSPFRARVIDIKGQAIAGAIAEIRLRGQPSFVTGPDGTFVFPHVHPDTTMIPLTIEADGYPKTGKEIGYRPDMGDAEIVLDPGWMLRGRVVDAQGRPVPEAKISVLSSDTNPRSGSTDAEGRFVVGPIAVDSWSVSFSKTGFRTAYRSINGPTEQPLDIILYRPISASGTVLDGQTGRPVERFRAMPGLVSPDGKKVALNRGDSYPGKAGHYECPFNLIYSHDPNTLYAVIIEADGYLPADSRVINPDEGAVVIDLSLTPGTGPAGTVADTNGLPAPNAFVYAIGESEGVCYYGSLPLFCNACPPRIKTGEDGRFSFEPLYRLPRLLAVADQGISCMAVEDLKVSQFLVLQPWAEVRGTLHSATGGPAKSRAVQMACLDDSTRLGFKWSLSTNTNGEGTFQIKQVPPGEFTLLGKTYQVAPGQVLTLDLTMDPNGPANPGL